MRALFDSIVRTFTPIIVGAVVGWFVTQNIVLDPEFETALTLVVGAVFSGLYYLAVRLLETYVAPRFGWLLGLAKPPVYVAPDTSATELAITQIKREILADHSKLTPSEQMADIQAARSAMKLPPL